MMHIVQPRHVGVEMLDTLPKEDPAAIRSRRDLRMVNRIMGTRGILLRGVRRVMAGSAPTRIIELGAGDGTLMLALAKQLCNEWPNVHLTLLDRQNIVDSKTVHGFHAIGWKTDIQTLDVMEWARQSDDNKWDLVIANLFIHHFTTQDISLLYKAIEQRAKAFFVCEPRRGIVPLWGSRMLMLIGVNDITRHDAVASVRAGFRARELSALWAANGSTWHIDEYSAGLFSHCFCATQYGS